MPEFDLETFFCSNPSNVKYFELQQCSVVVDGTDFIRFICSRIHSEDDGDYLKFSLESSAILSRFVQCGVTAIFVFEGIFSDTASQYAIPDVSAQDDPRIVPILAQDTLSSILKYYAPPPVVVNMPVFRAVCSLAANLHCPLLGSKNAYFLMGGSGGSAPPVFLPLCLLLKDIEPSGFHSKSSTAYRSDDAITAYAFCPMDTVLVQLDTAFWPVLCLLWNSGLTANRNQLLHSNDCETNFSSHQVVSDRLNGLIDWAKHLNEAMLNQLASVLFQGDRALLDEVCAIFICKPRTIGHLVKSLVNVSQANDSMCLHLEDEDQSSGILIDLEDVSSSERSLLEPQILSGWPPRLSRAYRQGDLPLHVLASLYLPKSSVKRTRLESVHGYLATHARSIAVLILRLFIGLEQRIGNQYKLIGLNADQSIWIPNSRSPQRCQVEPYYLNFRRDKTDDVLCKLLKLPQPVEIAEPDWLFGVAYTLGFWYHQVVERVSNLDGFGVPLKQCSMALAITAVAVATIYNVDYSYTELIPHYERVTKYVQSELSESLERRAAGSPSLQPPHLEPTREFDEILSIYRSLRSLVIVLDAIVRPDSASKLFCFLPPWIVFPSRALVGYLANHLDLQLSTIRLDHLSHFWLPKLLFSRRKAGALEQARDVFNRLLDLASIIIFKPETVDTPHCSSVHDSTQCDSLSESWSRGKVIKEEKDAVSSDWTRGNIQPVKENIQRSALREVSNFTPIRF